MVKELTSFAMEISIQENIRMENQKEKVNTLGETDKFMWENLKMD